MCDVRCDPAALFFLFQVHGVTGVLAVHVVSLGCDHFRTCTVSENFFWFKAGHVDNFPRPISSREWWVWNATTWRDMRHEARRMNHEP